MRSNLYVEMKKSSCIVLAVFILLTGISSDQAGADSFTWSGETEIASWHALRRLDPPDPELYVNNFGRIGDPPAFPGSTDEVIIPAAYLNPSIEQENVSVDSLITHGNLAVRGGNMCFIYSSLFNNSDMFQAIDGGIIMIMGYSLSNSGTIHLYYGGMFGGGILNFVNNCVVSGSGVVDLDYGYFTTEPGATVTHAAGHLIQGGNNSEIRASLINNGTIRSDRSDRYLYINTYDITNNNLLEATNNATLGIQGITITQNTTGRLLANNAQVQFLGGVTVQGGTLETVSNGYIYSDGDITNTISDLTNMGDIQVRNGAVLAVTGTSLINNGPIYLGLYGSGTLRFDTNCTLGGTGAVYLKVGSLSSSATATVTHESGHFIIGGGNSHISASIVNNGIIRADYTAENLYMDTYDISNNNLIESSHHANLGIQGITINQSPAGRLYANSGNINLTGGVSLQGGTLESSVGGYINCFGNITNSISELTNNADLRVGDGAVLSVTGSSLINDGTISILYGGMYGGGHLRIDDNITLTGSGKVTISTGDISSSNGSTLINDLPHMITGVDTINVNLDNRGVVEASGGTLNINGNVTQISGTTLTGGYWIARDNSNLNITTGNGIQTNEATIALDGAASQFGRINTLSVNDGSFYVLNGRNFTTVGNFLNSGLLSSGAGCTIAVNGLFSSPAGSITEVDGNLSSTIHTIIGGTLSGNGTVTGVTIIDHNGWISPGTSVGTLTTADLIFEDEGKYKWEINNSGSDLIQVIGNLTFDSIAVLEVVRLGGVVPSGDYILFEVTGTIGAMPEWTINLPANWMTDGVEVQGTAVLLKNLTITPPTPTPTPTTHPQTPTPTPTSGMPEFSLILDDADLGAGDIFNLHFTVTNPTVSQLYSDVYIVLGFGSDYWFWPSWIHVQQGIDHRSYTLNPFTQYSETALTFEWPSGVGSADGFLFIGAAFTTGTWDFIGDAQTIPWGFH